MATTDGSALPAPPAQGDTDGATRPASTEVLPPPAIEGFTPIFCYAPTHPGVSSNVYIAVGRIDLSRAGAAAMDAFRQIHARCLPIAYGDAFFASCTGDQAHVTTLAAYVYVADVAPDTGALIRGNCAMIGALTARVRPTPDPPATAASWATSATNAVATVWRAITTAVSGWVWGETEAPTPATAPGEVEASDRAGEEEGALPASPLPGQPRELYIMTLAVVPEARRCGCARTLLYTVGCGAGMPARHAHDVGVGITTMALDCMAVNQPALALYTGVGFGVSYHLPSHYFLFNEWHDGVRLEAPMPLGCGVDDATSWRNYVAAAVMPHPTPALPHPPAASCDGGEEAGAPTSTCGTGGPPCPAP